MYRSAIMRTVRILLPNQRDGLLKLEQQLSGNYINELSSTMSAQRVEIHLPKFKIEFDVDLKQPLKEVSSLRALKSQNFEICIL